MKKRDLGKQKPREKPKTQKNNLEWTYPRFFSQDCFLVFLDFLDNWGWGHQKTSRRTKQKKQSEIDLPQILLTGLFLLFFLVFLNFLGQLGLGTPKTSRKTEKTWGHPKSSRKTKNHKNLEWTYSRFFSEDYVFFGVVLEFLNIWKCGNGKKGKKQKIQKPNAPSGTFC